jgi:hypothetical protein
MFQCTAGIKTNYSRYFIEKESGKDVIDKEEQAVPNLGNGSKCMYCSHFGPL